MYKNFSKKFDFMNCKIIAIEINVYKNKNNIREEED